MDLLIISIILAILLLKHALALLSAFCSLLSAFCSLLSPLCSASMSLSDIPFETFLEALVPLLNVEDIGALSMVNKDLNEFCDENLVWRDLYLRTVRCAVTDDSVHLTKPGRGHNVDPCSFAIIYRYRHGGNMVKEYHPNSIVQPCGTLNANSPGTYGGICLPCMPNEVRAKVPKINPDLVNSIVGHASYGFHLAPTPENKDLILKRQEYSETIREVWQEHNASLGLSTVNLCQCPSHYKFETLAMPSSCKNSKSYKTAVLSKMNTQAKKPLRKMEKTLTRKQTEIQRIESHLAKLCAEEAELNQTFGQATTKSDRLNQSVQSLKARAQKALEDKKKAKKAKKKTIIEESLDM